jgi:hypothetical protein
MNHCIVVTGRVTLVVLALCPALPALPGTGGGGPTPPPQPISAWLLDDGSGATAADSYGALHGALEGGMGDPDWSIDTPHAYAGNTSLDFDGVNDRVKLHDGNVAAGRANVSLAAWFLWDDDGSKKEFTIFGDRDECGYNVTFLSIERRTGVANGLSFGVFERLTGTVCGTGTWHVTVSPGVPTAGAWHHAAAVLDESGGMSLYLDGSLVDSDANTIPYANLGGPSTLGHTHTSGYDSYWSGKLDEVAVFDHALSADQVGWLYANSLRHLPPPPVPYCTAGVSAAGCAALLSTSGNASAAAPSGFCLNASLVAGEKDGLFFFGVNGRQASPWGNGTSFQCVVPPVSRGGLLPGGGTAGACDGSFSQDLNALWCPACPKPLKNPGLGTIVQAQLWYRDPFSTSNQTTSLSNAIEFGVGP